MQDPTRGPDPTWPHVCLFLPGGRTLGGSKRRNTATTGAYTAHGVARLNRATQRATYRATQRTARILPTRARGTAGQCANPGVAPRGYSARPNRD